MGSDQIFYELETIASVNSKIAKQQLLTTSLQRHPSLQTILHYTYNPYKRYYLKTHLPPGQGTEQLKRKHLHCLDKLAIRTLSGQEGHDHVCRLLQALTPESATLFRRMIRKDLRIGMGAKLINQVLPGVKIPTHDIMLAQQIEWHRVRYPCWGTFKYDGVRGIYRDGKFYFRSGKEIQGLDHIIESLKGAPPLDGEILCPELSFQTGCGKIRSYDATPTAIFKIIDAPTFNSNSFMMRMSEAMKYCNEYVDVVPYCMCKSREDLTRLFRQARVAGFEGLIVKPLKYNYVGSRSYSWMKIKNCNSEDLRIIDIFQGKGRLAETLGGIIVDFNGVEVRVGTGFSDDLRNAIWEDPYIAIDHLAEIQYHEVTPDGSLREPRFIRFRDDKDETA